MKNNRTFLEKLLDGAEVEWKPLSLVSEMQRGKTITAKSTNEGKIPVISGGQKPAYYHSESNRDGKTITVAGSGAYAGYIMYWEEPIFVSDAFSIKTDESLLQIKYVYHFLLQNQQKIYAMKKGSGVPHVYPKDIGTLTIPIPPLSVQTEIVKILDALTALTSELTSELTLRRKQYEYYREKLLSFDSLELSGGAIQWIKLIDLGELIRGNGLQKKDFTETGVPAIHYGQIYTYYGTFATETKSFVSAELAKKLKKAKYGDVLIAGTSENVKDVMKPLGWLGSEIAFSGDMFAFRPNKKVNTKYLTYVLQTERFYKFKEKYAQGTKVIRIRVDNFLNYEIPLPPFEEQQRIVSILDKFETLTSSITEGLPLAIKQSQKRYEYYRELLLNFS
ncbi:restriction endonuclease subunit S [Aggregatibacter aphrophilus]|nr:restriction endonuclease subunit S [Aggregatibacter aphrophilus]RDE98928.1 restriction endonuclease subunit S [Aggregatibacter aphrophilus]